MLRLYQIAYDEESILEKYKEINPLTLNRDVTRENKYFKDVCRVDTKGGLILPCEEKGKIYFHPYGSIGINEVMRGLDSVLGTRGTYQFCNMYGEQGADVPITRMELAYIVMKDYGVYLENKKREYEDWNTLSVSVINYENSNIPCYDIRGYVVTTLQELKEEIKEGVYSIPYPYIDCLARVISNNLIEDEGLYPLKEVSREEFAHFLVQLDKYAGV